MSTLVRLMAADDPGRRLNDDLSTYVGASGTGGWKIGVRTIGGGSGAQYSTTLAANTTYFVVEELALGSTSVASIYVDPLPGGTQPGRPTPLSPQRPPLPRWMMWVSKPSRPTTTGNFDIGNLLIGTDWASVTPAAVPEPSSLALLGGGLVLAQMARGRFQKRS